MRINKSATARNLADNISENGAYKDEIRWLYVYGFEGFNHMSDERIETFITQDCCLDKESFPNIIVYEKEN